MNNIDSWATLIPFVFFIIAWLFAAFCFVWGNIDVRLLIKPEGKIKRGVKIGTKVLSSDAKHYLTSISENVIEHQNSFFGERIFGFIRVQNGEAIICYREAGKRSAFPHIGYVNLNLPEPALEIRSSLPMYLFLIPFVLTIILIPFVLIVVGLSYYRESTSFDKFLNRKVEEYKQYKTQKEREYGP